MLSADVLSGEPDAPASMSAAPSIQHERVLFARQLHLVSAPPTPSDQFVI